MITIFTPTYNRGKLLPELFGSLLKQTTHNFEWVIVDDGSEDNTHKIVEGMYESADFSIRYFYKKNGGKHTAINLGVRKAQGELFFILDSDDQLPAHAIEDVEAAYSEIKNTPAFAGVCGYIAHRDGRVIGHPMVASDANTIDLRYKLGVDGDMAEVYRTDILRKYPFPEIKGERFCPEMLVWNRIAQQYKLHIFPKVIYFRDYLAGGLTNNIIRIRMKSPVASMTTYVEMTTYDVPLSAKLRSAINYWRFWCCRKDISFPKLSTKWIVVFPIGLVLHWIDLIKIR